MLKRIILGIALAGALLLCQCAEEPLRPPDVTLGEQFTVGLGQTVELQGENLSITFSGVLQDSRCPMDVYCFWAGLAEIEVQLVRKSGDRAQLDLALLGGTRYNTPNPYTFDTFGYRFALLRLDPYPTGAHIFKPSSASTPPVPFVATLVITRASDTLSTLGQVTISDQQPNTILLDYFQINALSISGDTLSLDLQYPGGCRDHFFFLFMSPDSFADPGHPRATLWLRHYASYDSCKALIHRNLRFDLKPIADLYTLTYGRIDPIAISMSEYTGHQPENSFQAVYNPSGAKRNRAPVIVPVGSSLIVTDSCRSTTLRVPLQVP